MSLYKVNNVLLKANNVLVGDFWNGLISYWRFNETSGTNVADSKGIATGTLTTGTFNSGGKRDYCIYNANASAKIVDCGNVNNFEWYTPLTFNCWIKRTVNNVNEVMIFKQITGTAGVDYLRGYEFRINGANKLNFALNDSYAIRAVVCGGTNTIVAADNWVMCTVTYNGNGRCSGVSFYRNGVADTRVNETDTQLSVSTINTGSLTLLSRNASVYYALVGYLDEVAQWNRALMPTEVTQLYNAGNGIFY